MPFDRIDPWMITTAARAEWYRRAEMRARALASGEARPADAAADARLWDSILAWTAETLVIAGRRFVDTIPDNAAACAAEVASAARRAQAAWEKDGRPAGTRRHSDLAEIARLIAAMPARIAAERAAA